MGITLSYALGGEGRSFADVSGVSHTIENYLTEPRKEVGEYLEAPAYVREMFLFPYIYGITFAQQVISRLEWQNRNILYIDPPTSTEQILHPEKYIDISDRDEPIQITITDLTNILPNSWQPIYSTVLGEFNTFLLFNGYNRAIARAAAEGWEGDHIALYENGSDEQLLIYLSKWESYLDTRQFYNAYRLVIEAKYPNAELTEETSTSITWQDEQNYIRLARHKTYALVIEGATTDLMSSLYSQLMPSSRSTSH